MTAVAPTGTGISASPADGGQRRQAGGPSRLRALLIALPFLLPSLVGVVAFLLIPVVLLVVYSFLHWNLLTSPTWAGFSNFTGIFEHDHALRALLLTIYYVALNVPLQTVLAILLALMLNSKLPAMGVFRTLYVVPYMATPVAMAVVWNWILDPKLGAINVLLGHLGISGPGWLTTTALAMPMIALINIWQYLGYNMLFFLAGLQAIPRQLHEAAAIDGAGKFKEFFSITMPLLRPTLLFVLVTDVIGSFQIFDTVWVLTQGGPGNSTEVLNVSIYQTAFVNFDIGGASAMSLVLFGVILLVTIVQFTWFRKRTVYQYV